MLCAPGADSALAAGWAAWTTLTRMPPASAFMLGTMSLSVIS